MIRDLFFVIMVLSVSVYAHTNKNKIIYFIEVMEEEMFYEDSDTVDSEHIAQNDL